MIQLEKDEASAYSDQDIQELIRRVYDYAADLRINKELSWDEVRDKLVNQGVDNAGAQTVVDNLREQEQKAWRSAALKEIGYGFLWTLGGALLTLITAGAFIFYGAVLWGIWLIIKGLWHLATK